MRGRATRINVAQKQVEVEGAEAVPYDTLLIATGAEPIHLGLPGEDQPHVHYLRSLADSRAIIAASEKAKRAVVIGGSFIGLEAAASLRARELEVHVVAPEALPLERVLGTELGDVHQGRCTKRRASTSISSTSRSASRRMRWCSTTGRGSRRIWS